MELYERLKNDMINAMKSKEKEKLTVIRMVKAAVDLEHIDKKRVIDDELVMDVITKEIKTRKESIESFKSGSRDDLIEKTESEIKILNDYLPEPLTEKEVLEIIDNAFSEINPTGIKDMGNIMKIVTPKVKGKYDMKQVSEIIRGKLQ